MAEQVTIPTQPGREVFKFRESVVLVYKDAATGRTVKILDVGPNIVTNAGDLYYAQRGATETPTHTFNKGQMIVGRSMTVINASKKTATFGRFIGLASTYTGRQSFEVNYPRTSDPDTDNTGRTVDAVTYKRVYLTSQANYTIGAVGVCRHAATTNSSGQLLSAKTLPTASKVVKTSSLTLTVYVNHVFLGT
jgi:hypothetical protein